MNTLYDDLRATLHSIWRRRWLALIVAWVVCVAGWLVLAMVPNSYESHARILVQLYDPLAAQVGIGEADRKRDIDRIRDTLTSTPHLQRVILSTRLGDQVTSPEQMENAVQGLGKAIKIVSTQDNLFEITATSASMRMSDKDNAVLSRDIVQRLIDIFREENQGVNADQLSGSMQFLDQQLVARQKELEEAEQRRLAFESQHPELAQGGVSLIQRLEQDRQQLRNLDGDMVAAQGSLAAVNGQIAGTQQTVAGVGPGAGPRGALAQAQSDLAALRARGLTENHPDVIATRNQIASLKQQVQADGGNAVAGGLPNPAYSTLESIRADRQAAIEALRARKVAIEQDIAQATAQQTSNPDLVSQAQSISRDYDVLKQQYDKLLAGREEMRLRGQIANQPTSLKFQIIDPPTVPRAPIAPNRRVLLFVVLLAGVGAGLGAAFAMGELKATYATVAKLERSTDLPVLGAISQSSNRPGVARAARMTTFYVAAAALGGLFLLLLAAEWLQRATLA